MTRDFLTALRAARNSGDVAAIAAAIPYSRFMGITARLVDDEPTALMTFSNHLVGNAAIGALHGGTMGALLESAAVFKLLWSADTEHLPKTINITVEYLRSAQMVDTWARAEFIRQGRRVANVRAIAWQEDEARPVAAANAHFLLTPPSP